MSSTSGMGCIYRRGGVYWIDYGHRGKRYRESSRSHRKADAKALLRKRIEEMGRGHLVGPRADQVTLADLGRLLISDYKQNSRRSTRRAELSARNLTRFFGSEVRALDITTAKVNAYIDHRREHDGVAPATIRNELAALKRAFNLAIEAGLLDRAPHIPTPQIRNTRTGFFERPEFEAVLAELPEYLRPPMEFGYLTGWRVMSEALRLSWSQVDFKAGTVRLEPLTTKNDEGRTFPFDVLPELQTLLTRQRECTTALEKATGSIIASVFHNNGRPIKEYRRAWKSACRRAGVVGMLVHDFRRTAVRNLERAGVPRSVAMRLTGHKTESVYRRYAIVSESDLREGVQKLANLHRSDRDQARQTVPFNAKTAQ